MKHKFLFVLLVSISTFACTKKVAINVIEPAEEQVKEMEEQVTEEVSNLPVPVEEGTPKMTFEKRVLDLGKVKKGDQIPLTYSFTNTGDAPLEIDLISVCDCTTVTDRPYLPIQPGEKGIIKAVFDSNQKDESETIDIDIWLKNIDPVLDMPVLERIQYQYEFVK